MAFVKGQQSQVNYNSQAKLKHTQNVYQRKKSGFGSVRTVNKETAVAQMEDD